MIDAKEGLQIVLKSLRRRSLSGWADPVERAIAELDRLRSRYEEEHAIVDRCWKALGIDTYEAANGKAIHELIADLKAAQMDPEKRKAQS
jgi:hypothetical protein